MAELKKTKTTRFLQTVALSAQNLLFKSGVMISSSMVLGNLFTFWITSHKAHDSTIDFVMSGLVPGIFLGVGLFIATATSAGIVSSLVSKIRVKYPSSLTLLDNDAYYQHEVLALAQQSNSHILKIKKEDILEFQKNVLSQLIILSKDFSETHEESIEQYKAAHPGVNQLFEKNLKIDFQYDPNHFWGGGYNPTKIDTLVKLNDWGKQRGLENMAASFKQEVQRRNINLLDIAYDLRFLQLTQLNFKILAGENKLSSKTENKANYHMATLCLLAEATLQNGSTLNAAQTKEFLQTVNKLPITQLEDFFMVVLKSLHSTQQLDIPQFLAYIQTSQKFSLAHIEAFKQIIEGKGGADMVAENPTEALSLQDFHNVQGAGDKKTTQAANKITNNKLNSDLESTVSTQVESIFPSGLLDSLRPEALRVKTQDLSSSTSLQGLQNNLTKIRDTMLFLENNAALLPSESQIEMRVLCIKSVPHILNYLQVLTLLDKEDLQAATQSLEKTTQTIWEHLDEHRQTLKQQLLKDIQVIGQQFETKKSLRAAR